MVRSGEYELLPQEEIRRLRHELDELKTKGYVPGSEHVTDSIKKLTDYLQDLLVVFEKASEDLREEDKEAEIIAKKINPIFDRISVIEEQNSKIAKAMVALNSMVDGKIKELVAQAERVSQSSAALNANMQQIMAKLDELKHTQSMMTNKMAVPPPIVHAPEPMPPPPVASQQKEKGFHLFKH